MNNWRGIVPYITGDGITDANRYEIKHISIIMDYGIIFFFEMLLESGFELPNVAKNRSLFSSTLYHVRLPR